MITPNKLKILVCSEASFLNTGFAGYTKELLQRLYDSNKYELAEFACYSTLNDPRRKNIPWKFYANAVSQDDPRQAEYYKSIDNQFGRWRFEKVLLDFRPDVVIDIRDYWMHYYQSVSPLRKYFHWIAMPTVDSHPQQESWIETYIGADAVFTYSDWGAKILKQQSNNKINYISTVSPGIDLELFKPLNNEKLKNIKNKFNITDLNIIGSVMRNQKRKLFPELMLVFKGVLDELKINNSHKKDNTYLWLHTGYPDAGWDIPLLLKTHNIFDKVLFTYYCQNCSHVSPSVFIGAKTSCPSCGSNNFSMPSVIHGPSREQMCEIYNCFDLYVQYSICEGFGMPQVEAAACGNHIITVDYSAMVDIVDKLKATPISINQEFMELETKAIRVYPSNENAQQIIFDQLNKTALETQKLKEKSRQLVEEHYNWENIYKTWEKYLDSLKPGLCSNRKWSDPPEYLEPIPEKIIDQQIPASQHLNILTQICIKHLKDIKALCSIEMLNLLSYADYGFVQNGANLDKYTINNLLKAIQSKILNVNNVEAARFNNIKIQEDFIQQA